MDALRTGDDEGVAKALALIESNEVEEVEGDPVLPLRADEDEGLDLTDRCWFSEVDGCWMTNFPPPAGFTGYESRGYDEEGDRSYERVCTPEEIEILEADAAADRALVRAEDEMLRDEWFALLRKEASADPARTCSSGDCNGAVAIPIGLSRIRSADEAKRWSVADLIVDSSRARLRALEWIEQFRLERGGSSWPTSHRSTLASCAWIRPHMR